MLENAQLMSTGLRACAEAFERLKAGTPCVEAHIGLSASRITAGAVSVEAGFDRGYLKKSRPAHVGLISQIDSYRSKGKLSVSPKGPEAKLTQAKLQHAQAQLKIARGQLQAVLTQNLQLVERVRDLEIQLAGASFHTVQVLPKR